MRMSEMKEGRKLALEGKYLLQIANCKLWLVKSKMLVKFCSCLRTSGIGYVDVDVVGFGVDWIGI